MTVLYVGQQFFQRNQVVYVHDHREVVKMSLVLEDQIFDCPIFFDFDQK